MSVSPRRGTSRKRVESRAKTQTVNLPGRKAAEKPSRTATQTPRLAQQKPQAHRGKAQAQRPTLPGRGGGRPAGRRAASPKKKMTPKTMMYGGAAGGAFMICVLVTLIMAIGQGPKEDTHVVAGPTTPSPTKTAKVKSTWKPGQAEKLDDLGGMTMAEWMRETGADKNEALSERQKRLEQYQKSKRK